MMRIAIKLLVACALIAYPVAVYFADGWLTPSQLVAGLLLLIMIRLLVLAWITTQHRTRNLGLAAALFVASLAVLKWLPAIGLDWLRLYPTLFNLAAFGVFFGSLFTKMPLVERMARLTDPDLPPQAVAYTRGVTWLWSAVLLCNTLASLYTAFATSFEVWTLYNGVIAYLLFGCVFLGEYLLRTHLKRKWTAA